MLDLHFAEDKVKRSYDCKLCLKNPATSRDRRCAQPGFENLKKPRRVDDKGLEYKFCPGKATWYDEIAELFLQCRTAMETGIMPNEGPFEQQSEMFVDAFPHFVSRWKDRTYDKIWHDVRDFTKTVLEGLFGKKGGK